MGSIHKKLMTLFTQGGYDEKSRHDMVYTFTSGRTKSTRDLSPHEIKALILKLDSSYRNPRNGYAAIEIEKKKRRSIVLAIATRVGLHDPTDWAKFNGFMKERSILKKQLNQYSIEELDKLIIQFRGIERNFNNSSKKVGTKAHSIKNKLPLIILN